ncbi:MAG: PEP-CTERM sorting domain-containing protein [Planctomycetota bacterium]
MLKSQRTVSIDPKRWAAYACAGLAAANAGAQTAEADTITHIVVGSANNGELNVGDTKFFNLVGSGASAFSIFLGNSDLGGGAGNALMAIADGSAFGTFAGSVAGPVLSSFLYASRLDANVNISALNFARTYGYLAYSAGGANSQFLGQSGFVAFAFDQGAGSQYGWARLTSVSGAPANTFVLEEYAFADVGTPISTGQVTAVPEPSSSLGLLAMGAAGLAAHRRRRKPETLKA